MYPSVTPNNDVSQEPAADISIDKIVGQDMVDEVSEIHVAAFSGYLNARLGETYARALIHWFSKQEGAIALAAVDRDHRVIGYAIGAPPALALKLRSALFWVTARSIILHPWVILDSRLWKVGYARFMKKSDAGEESRGPDLPEPVISLFGIGVKPSHRQRGIGRRLLLAFEERATLLKARALLLWVYADKMSTRHLYEKCGWQSCPGSLESTGVTKYVRLLDQNSV